MTASDVIQIVLMALLVGVTGIYAWLTHVISKETKAQADASVIMAEETREQRYSENLPLLIPDIPPISRAEKLPIENMRTGVGVKVVWSNVGKGVAINSRFSFWCAPLPSERVNFFPSGDSVTLEVGAKKEIDYSEILNDSEMIDMPSGYVPKLQAEYQDINERTITTIQEFRVEEQNNRKTVILGELYFTVNGRRLGEEVTWHD